MWAWGLLFVVLLGIGVWAYFRGPGIIIPVPSSVANRVGTPNGNGFLYFWRIFLLLLVPFVLLALIALESYILMSVLAGVVAIILVGPLRQAIGDYWDFNFPRLGGK